jgi:hypothetical protein
MQQPGNVVVVVPNAESLGDEVANHRPGPDAARIPRYTRPVLDEYRKLRALRLREPRRATWRLAGQQSLDAECFIPAKPSVDGAAGHIDLRCQVDDAPSLYVSEDRVRPAPDIEVVVCAGSLDETTEFSAARRRTPLRANRLAVLGTRHDHPPK